MCFVNASPHVFLLRTYFPIITDLAIIYVNYKWLHSYIYSTIILCTQLNFPNRCADAKASLLSEIATKKQCSSRFSYRVNKF